MPSPEQPDRERHQPLPPLTRLPAHLWRRLPTVARAALVLFGLVTLVAAVALAPRISDTKRDNAAREKREAAAFEARRIRGLRALQRPRTSRSARAERAGAVPSARERRRRGLLRDLGQAIAADARSRGARRVLRTDCRGAPGSPAPARDLTRARVPLACVAVTGGIASSRADPGVTVGYPYRAVADFRSGRLTWCRVAGQAGEGGFSRRRQVPVPAVCTR